MAPLSKYSLENRKKVTEMMNQINNLESKSDSPDLNIPILIERASSKANDDFQGSLLELRTVFGLTRYKLCDIIG